MLELEGEARAKLEQNEHNFIAYIDGLLVYISQFKRAASDLLGKLSARRRDHSARQHAPFPLGQIREYVTQVTAMGPLGLEYLSAKDDPRKSKLLGES